MTTVQMNEATFQQMWNQVVTNSADIQRLLEQTRSQQPQNRHREHSGRRNLTDQ